MSNFIACSHPGKHGDAIYALPAIKALSEKHGKQVDFYTSGYCEPLKALFENQPYIHKFYVSPNYVAERFDMGAQPWYVPIDESQYEATYHLGYKGTPDCTLPEFIARSVPITIGNVCYEVPPQRWFDRPYIVMAARGDSSYKNLFADTVANCPITTMMIGAKGDDLVVKQILQDDFRKTALDCTGWDYLDTAALIAGAKAFVGLISSQLCIANGFPIPKIAPNDGHSWDSRHWIRSEFNHYLVNPSAADILALI